MSSLIWAYGVIYLSISGMDHSITIKIFLERQNWNLIGIFNQSELVPYGIGTQFRTGLFLVFAAIYTHQWLWTLFLYSKSPIDSGMYYA
ncbi:hypothetical protein [Legionella quateirensis]|uniref:Uncharacterized protein n=1 Tax=Legionella quateirensis TaxID=45072 RepID=A0A378L1E9_9GAMM|nr:hypothetical protein [Legionella quateirensis]KTD44919.1 hypothetical protein Lqua_2754 [Legionella quateirensis]STY19458.1 Uncharacterised protein [Legionella quateirensis]